MTDSTDPRILRGTADEERIPSGGNASEHAPGGIERRRWIPWLGERRLFRPVSVGRPDDFSRRPSSSLRAHTSDEGPMSNLHDILQAYVSNGSVPGAVGLIARGGRVEVQAAGSADVGGTSPMARDSIFRIASITKPITAAAVMMLVEDGRIALDDPVDRWLPELAKPVVVRTPAC